MSVAVLTPATPSPTPPQMRRYQRPFSVDEYHRLIDAGVLKEDEPVELLEGWIVYKMPRNPRHDSTVYRTQMLLACLLGPSWVVRAQSAITTADSEPEPDVVVAVGPDGRYDGKHPGPTDLALVVEVADSSLPDDRDVKGRLYARGSIRLYWIVNLQDWLVEVYTGASGASYQPPATYRSGDTIPLSLPDGTTVHIPVHDLFPAANP